MQTLETRSDAISARTAITALNAITAWNAMSVWNATCATQFHLGH
jgi:hypothetical protein